MNNEKPVWYNVFQLKFGQVYSVLCSGVGLSDPALLIFYKTMISFCAGKKNRREKLNICHRTTEERPYYSGHTFRTTCSAEWCTLLSCAENNTSQWRLKGGKKVNSSPEWLIDWLIDQSINQSINRVQSRYEVEIIILYLWSIPFDL
jgi:Zn-finger protein